MSHDYYLAQAEDAFAAAGGDVDNAGQLAAWAEAARSRPDMMRLGVIVAADGQLIAETIRLHVTVAISAVYVNRLLVDLPDPSDVRGTILDLAVGSIRRQLGQPVIHVPAWQVCTGAARRLVAARPAHRAEVGV
ncbi:MAG: hypothetical protein VB093_12080 [Propionicimonas sp.]|nr:hypothetical protein [Propionicimonas sp.]